MNSQYLTYNATLGGIVFSLMPYLAWDQLIQTALLAGIGALVSLGVSLVFRYLIDFLQRLKDK